MKKETVFLIFFLFLLFLSVYLLYQTLAPFLTPIVWAIILSMIFYPLFKRLQRRLGKMEILPALIMTLFVFSVIVIPFSLLATSLAVEVVEAYHKVQKMIETGELKSYLEKVKEIPAPRWVLAQISQYFDLAQMDFQGLLLKNVQDVSTFAFNQTSKMLKGLSTFLASFFFTLLSLYYFFKDGDHLYGRLKEFIPLPPEEKGLLLNRFKDMIHATVYGGIVIALIQGILGGTSFWILGISSPIVWGTAMGLFSFIPLGGTALIWVPASLLLLAQGALAKGLILIAIGVFVISMADNILRPFFISSKTNIHPLLLFFAVLGGIQAFGFIGLIVGPLVTTLSLALIEIYLEGIKRQRSDHLQESGAPPPGMGNR